MRRQGRDSSDTISTNVGGETSLERRRLEEIVKRCQARPRILLKPIDRERGEASGVPDMFGRSQLEKGFIISNLVRTIGSWTAGSSTHPSSTSTMIHPPPT